MQPEELLPDEGRRAPGRRRHGEFAALTTAAFLIACWAMLVL